MADTERCPRCKDRVYMAEQVLAGKQKYHKRCFTCNNKPTCNKSLDSGSFNEHDGQVYCKGCYGKLFGPKGYGYGGGAGFRRNVIKMLNDDCKSQVICNTVLTDTFNVTTGVKQGCILSPFLFVLGIDWIMKQVTSNRRRGIGWTLTSILEDLDYADDIVLLSHRYQDMQAKTNTLATTAGSLA
ncbi:hypothetical protein ACROYT_G036552 [Oculina patagonica]